jgi:hypothetical protein
MVYTHSTNIYGLVKLFLLKFSVGLIVLEVSVGQPYGTALFSVHAVPYRMRDQILQTLAAPPCCFVCCGGHVTDLRCDFVDCVGLTSRSHDENPYEVPPPDQRTFPLTGSYLQLPGGQRQRALQRRRRRRHLRCGPEDPARIL